MDNRKTLLLNRMILILIGVCLVVGLAPSIDFDFDGMLDSILTEGMLMIPILAVLALPDLLFVPLSLVRVISRLYSPDLLVPPPNFSN
jgi:hypothetical protein